MRLDDVEIKISFTREQTPRAVQELALPARPDSWQIHFCEDVTPTVPSTPLLDLGVILRARIRPDDDDDFTVKLRPCRGSQLTDHWVKETDKLKVEADWAGDRHVLAASHTDKRPQALIPTVVAKQLPFKDLFTEQQLAFLVDCASVTINLDALTVLPPVTAVRWKNIAAAPQELGLRAERWTVADLDFLELSAVAPVEEAASKQDAIHHFLSSLGLEIPDEREPKTRQVMEHLVRISLGAG
jgi:hypothetical protein